MSYWTKWRVYLASKRIARRAESYANTGRYKKDRKVALVDNSYLKDVRTQYPDDIVLRLDSIQRRSFQRLPLLPERLEGLVKDSFYRNDGPNSEDYNIALDHIERLSTMLHEVEDKWGDASFAGYARAANSALDIILPVAQLCIVSAPWLSAITVDQQRTLLAVSFLRIQRSEDISEVALKMSYVRSGSVPVNPNQWLHAKALKGGDPGDIIREYEDRAERRMVIGKVFNIFTVPDQLCDYPDDLIDKLLSIRGTRLFSLLFQYHLKEGVPESWVREAIRFGNNIGSPRDTRQLLEFVKILSRHPYSPWLPVFDDYSRAPSPVPEQCEALLSVATAYGDASQPRDYLGVNCIIKDERMVQLLIKHPERGDRIATAIRERHIYDFESLEQLSETVLSEGML